ncbi:hypothetical protein GUJ93_ZPchr0009g575 [Zizania palustris]|uniref:MIR domain-containing protein n=1 Tax=Zizania palustris TaxID=103762 RepID=A0A8J5RPS2_ZIZPA|nr:hypothetical protein GUJ93_ZPchr0009g575 [Zizania palustris]
MRHEADESGRPANLNSKLVQFLSVALNSRASYSSKQPRSDFCFPRSAASSFRPPPPAPPSPAPLAPPSPAPAPHLGLDLPEASPAQSYAADPDNVVEITYGSVIKLMHERTKFRLHSHDVPYGSGSGQQSVTSFPNVDDANSYWKTLDKQSKWLGAELEPCGGDDLNEANDDMQHVLENDRQHVFFLF